MYSLKWNISAMYNFVIYIPTLLHVYFVSYTSDEHSATTDVGTF